MKIGLYFGSFNPIHIGHLIIANYIVETSFIDELWFIPSPQNPLKKQNSLLNEYHRLHLIQISIEGENKLKASNVEFSLKKPSYTFDTLSILKKKYPLNEFIIIMGSDSFQNINKWKNHKELIEENKFIIYNRPGFQVDIFNDKMTFLDAPLLQISSTHIREMIKQKKSIKFFVPDNVKDEIEKNRYYL